MARVDTHSRQNLVPYLDSSTASVLASREEALWTTIRHLQSRSITKKLLMNRYGFRQRQASSSAAAIDLYIKQAWSFYQSGQHADSRTSPLQYYYSFMHLAKALIETRNPNLATRRSNGHHGLSRTAGAPPPFHLPDRLTIRGRGSGVFQDLFEATTGRQWSHANNIIVTVDDLVRCLPECNVEAARAGITTDFIEMASITGRRHMPSTRYWVEIECTDRTLGSNMLVTAGQLATRVSTGRNFVPIPRPRGTRPSVHWATTSTSLSPRKAYENSSQSLSGLNLYCSLQANQTTWLLPHLWNPAISLPLPQLCNTYAVFFWLGSLVRYDPLTLADLEESEHWALIDAILSESRHQLLYLFCWSLYDQFTVVKQV